MALNSTPAWRSVRHGRGVVVSAVVWLVPWIVPVPALLAEDGSRLAFWLPWELPSLATLVYGIALIAFSHGMRLWQHSEVARRD